MTQISFETLTVEFLYKHCVIKLHEKRKEHEKPIFVIGHLIKDEKRISTLRYSRIEFTINCKKLRKNETIDK